MKVLFIILGSLSLSLGIIGIILPVLPTTPFLLLSATLFMHSSPRLYDWLLNHKYFGATIRAYREDKVISVKAKVLAMITLWSTLLFSIYTIGVHKLWLPLLLFGVGVGVSWHILRHRSTIK